MKRIIIIIMILLMNVLAYGQGVKLNNAPPLHYGKYTSVTNSSEISIGNDIINAEGLSYDLLYMINANDTSFSLNKVVPQYYGQWNSLTNNNKIIFGNDTANKGDISARFVYCLNMPSGGGEIPHYLNVDSITAIKSNINSLNVTGNETLSGELYLSPNNGIRLNHIYPSDGSNQDIYFGGNNFTFAAGQINFTGNTSHGGPATFGNAIFNGQVTFNSIVIFPTGLNMLGKSITGISGLSLNNGSITGISGLSLNNGSITGISGLSLNEGDITHISRLNFYGVSEGSVMNNNSLFLNSNDNLLYFKDNDGTIHKIVFE